MRNFSNTISYSSKVLLVILCCCIYLNNSFADTLSVNTNHIQDTMQITFIFNFTQGSPNSVIAIEKPQDSIFISATDSNSNSIRPSTIGDFYRFELSDREITNFTIQFSSRNTYLDIFRTGEQVLYVNSNVKLDRINVDFDIVREFENIIEIFPRNYEYEETRNRILIHQIGALEDNMFRIRYEVDNSSSFSTWIVILLTIPIIFFIALYFVLKIKPENKDKKLDDFIAKDSKNTTDDNQNLEQISNQDTRNSSDENLKSQIQQTPQIIYSFNNELDNNNKVKDDNHLDTNINELNEQQTTIEPQESNASQVPLKKNPNDNDVSTPKLEEYIQKYFTENEQDVIRVINKQEGIMQQEILDNLPIFTKSTLSKIITKLEGKKIIERVRVGKVNKLFLGSELKKLVSNQIDEKNQ
ncbi:MAG: hypothetical protein LAT82_05170 [Nanoarchaeota archaeon]|nr:hypothetical protein [Nanoarchaeota archaeon]